MAPYGVALAPLPRLLAPRSGPSMSSTAAARRSFSALCQGWALRLASATPIPLARIPRRKYLPISCYVYIYISINNCNYDFEVYFSYMILQLY